MLPKISLICLLTIKLVNVVSCDGYMSSIFHCSESNPQSHVDIEQLMGMWYGIEIINHKSEAKVDNTMEEGCPVLYFSEDRTPTTYRPMYGDYNYQQNYGSGYGRGYNGQNVYGKSDEVENDSLEHKHQLRDKLIAGFLKLGFVYNICTLNVYTNVKWLTINYYENQALQINSPIPDIYSQYTTQNPVYSSEYQQYHNQPSPNDHDYNSYNRHNKNLNINDPNRLRYHEQMKHMRLLWVEKGVHTEYSIRYNVTKPGVWFTSGPQNGSALEPKFNSFAGTMQVLKAVGNHMVLSFCFQLPDQQLFTVLLSRVQNFSQSEIHGVHNMLHRYGYTTSSIRRVCTYSGAISTGGINYWYLFILAACSYFIRRF